MEATMPILTFIVPSATRKGFFRGTSPLSVTFKMLCLPYWEVQNMGGVSLEDTLRKLNRKDPCCPTEKDALDDACKKRSDHQCLRFLRPSAEQLSLFHQEVMPVMVDATSSLPVVSKTTALGFSNENRPSVHELMVIAADSLHLDVKSLPWDVHLERENETEEAHKEGFCLTPLQRHLCNQWIGCKDKYHGVCGILRPTSLAIPSRLF